MSLFAKTLSKKSLLAVAVSAVFALSACGSDNADSAPQAGGEAAATASATETAPVTPSTSAPATEKSESTIYVGIDPTYAPFVDKTEDGTIVGFDADLLTEIGKREGFEIKLLPKAWSGIFTGLEDNSLDVVMGGAVATDERREKYGVSDSYHQVTTVILTKEESGIKSHSDVRDKKVAYTKGGSVARVLEELQGTQTLDTSQDFASSWLRVKSVLVGTSDAAIGTSASFEYYANTYPEQKLKVIYADKPEYDDVVFIVGKNNTALLEKINRGLKSVQEDGTLEQLKAKWLKPAEQK